MSAVLWDVSARLRAVRGGLRELTRLAKRLERHVETVWRPFAVPAAEVPAEPAEPLGSGRLQVLFIFEDYRHRIDRAVAMKKEHEMTGPHRNEEFKITGDELLAKARELLHEGNVRRLIIKNEGGHTLVEIPMTIGLVGAALLPVLAAVGAIAALATNCTIVVEREA